MVSVRKIRHVRVVRLLHSRRVLPIQEKVFETNLDVKQANKIFETIKDYGKGKLKRKYYLKIMQTYGIGKRQSYRLLGALRTGKLFVRLRKKIFNTNISFASSSPECHIQASFNSFKNPHDVIHSFEFQHQILEELKKLIEEKEPRKRNWGQGRQKRTPERDSVYVTAILMANYICEKINITETRKKEFCNAWITGSHYVISLDIPTKLMDELIESW